MNPADIAGAIKEGFALFREWLNPSSKALRRIQHDLAVSKKALAVAQDIFDTYEKLLSETDANEIRRLKRILGNYNEVFQKLITVS